MIVCVHACRFTKLPAPTRAEPGVPPGSARNQQFVYQLENRSAVKTALGARVGVRTRSVSCGYVG